jgi:hypothetical protein
MKVVGNRKESVKVRASKPAADIRQRQKRKEGKPSRHCGLGIMESAA